MTINQVTNGSDSRTALTTFLGVVDRAAMALLFGLVMMGLPLAAFGLLA
jgi:hypothetical protein